MHWPTSAFDFELPPELIAQQPDSRRDACRLLVVDRSSGALQHREFSDLGMMIPAGDALALNTTRVMRARLLGTRASGGAAEVLLLRELDTGQWEAMVHPGGKVRPGRVITIAPGFTVQIDAITERRTRLVTLRTEGPVRDAIERHGHVPLPPYIDRADTPVDAERYQTVYAEHAGSVAAPTAGLHFTPELLHAITNRGVHRIDTVLHVGAGTFRPVECEDPADHVMHEEWCEVPAHAAQRLAAVRAAGGKVWATGTTTVRTLESFADADGRVHAGQMLTRAFFRPPWQPRVVDRLITNFHLPRSTLLMLVAAFTGYDLAMEAYQVAIRERYRFYSYGDAMLIL